MCSGGALKPFLFCLSAVDFLVEAALVGELTSDVTYESGVSPSSILALTFVTVFALLLIYRKRPLRNVLCRAWAFLWFGWLMGTAIESTEALIWFPERVFQSSLVPLKVPCPWFMPCA